MCTTRHSFWFYFHRLCFFSAPWGLQFTRVELENSHWASSAARSLTTLIPQSSLSHPCPALPESVVHVSLPIGLDRRLDKCHVCPRDTIPCNGFLSMRPSVLHVFPVSATSTFSPSIASFLQNVAKLYTFNPGLSRSASFC